GTALAGLERNLHPQAAALQLGDEVRQPVVSMRSSGPVLSTGPVWPAGRGVVHRASAETYVIRYVRSPSLINPSATSRQPHRCTVAIADTAGVPEVGHSAERRSSERPGEPDSRISWLRLVSEVTFVTCAPFAVTRVYVFEKDLGGSGLHGGSGAPGGT